MRDRFLQSAFAQPELIAAGTEEALKIMWRRWCDRLPVEPIEIVPRIKRESQ
jgi:hypothetical protein